MAKAKKNEEIVNDDTNVGDKEIIETPTSENIVASEVLEEVKTIDESIKEETVEPIKEEIIPEATKEEIVEPVKEEIIPEPIKENINVEIVPEIIEEDEIIVGETPKIEEDSQIFLPVKSIKDLSRSELSTFQRTGIFPK